MLKSLFECEAEVGRCSFNDDRGGRLEFAEPEFARVFVHTLAQIDEREGMLKLEHRCYLRSGERIQDQQWIKPESHFKPAIGSREHLAKIAQSSHDRFVRRAESKIPNENFV